MSVRRIREISAVYLPMEWGVKVQGEDIIAWARLKRTDNNPMYGFYGDDADAYKEFEEAGFTLSKRVSSFAEADEWIKKEVLEG